MRNKEKSKIKVSWKLLFFKKWLNLQSKWHLFYHFSWTKMCFFCNKSFIIFLSYTVLQIFACFFDLRNKMNTFNTANTLYEFKHHFNSRYKICILKTLWRLDDSKLCFFERNIKIMEMFSTIYRIVSVCYNN